MVFCVNWVSAFNDTEYNWYKESINALKQDGVVNGYDDGRFLPHEAITRAEILKIILSSFDKDIISPEVPCFIDVDIMQWQAKYICTGSKLGISKWYDDGTFRQQENVTVLETIAFSLRALEVELKETIPWESWYEKYQKFAHDNNIIPIHSYTIDSIISRGQAADVIEKIRQYSQWKTPDYKSVWCFAEPQLSSWSYTIEVSGLKRNYLLYVPSGVKKNKEFPLIVAFHGRTNSNEMVRDYMKLWGGKYGSTRKQKDFIVAYPAGMWVGPYSWSQYENIEFFDALITAISEKLCIDRDSIFTVGHSLWSYMSNKVSCLRWEVIRGMVGVASDGYNGACTGPVTSLITHLPGDHLATYQWWLNAYSYKSRQNICWIEEKNITLWDIKNCSQKISCSDGNTVIFCNSYTWYGNDPHSWPKEGSDDILDFLKNIENYTK